MLRPTVACLVFLAFLTVLGVASHLVHHLAAGLSLPKGCLHWGRTRGSALDQYAATDYGAFKSYRPDVFERLRRHGGVSEQLYRDCLTPSGLQGLRPESKSGGCFWRSVDGTVVLKTIRHSECVNLRRALDRLAEHVLPTTGANGYSNGCSYSCLGNVLGLYRLRSRWGRRTYLIACANVYSSDPQAQALRFDLKGSSAGRRRAHSAAVGKDLDLLDANRTLALGYEGKAQLLAVLRRDLQLLSALGLMDYSLLLEEGVLEEVQGLGMRMDKGVLVLQGRAASYRLGLVDWLQGYGLRKRAEHWLKARLLRMRGISCVPPEQYEARLLDFVDRITTDS